MKLGRINFQRFLFLENKLTELNIKVYKYCLIKPLRRDFNLKIQMFCNLRDTNLTQLPASA